MKKTYWKYALDICFGKVIKNKAYEHTEKYSQQ